MSHLLHVDSSIRPIEQSRSRKLSKRYADAWQASNPDGTVTYRDLSADPIPHTNAASFYANFLAPEDRSAEQAEAKAITDEIVGEVLAADTTCLAWGCTTSGSQAPSKPGLTASWFQA